MTKAILMAAGLGTRMRPLTETMPKPMIEVNGTSMVETVVKGLLENNVD
jgi:NDP-sugar pyrophosphorylase family protein